MKPKDGDPITFYLGSREINGSLYLGNNGIQPCWVLGLRRWSEAERKSGTGLRSGYYVVGRPTTRDLHTATFTAKWIDMEVKTRKVGVFKCQD